jgi:hypothetical protein
MNAQVPQSPVPDPYQAGVKFQIMQEGACIVGTVPIAAWTTRGFRRLLKVGEIITCAGTSMTAGDGCPIVKWRDSNGEYICDDAEFTPRIGGMWDSKPDPRYLAPLVALAQVAAEKAAGDSTTPEDDLPKPANEANHGVKVAR